MISYGPFISTLINFLILAFIFLLTKAASKAMRQQEATRAPAGPSEVELLAEIRDELKKRA